MVAGKERPTRRGRPTELLVLGRKKRWLPPAHRDDEVGEIAAHVCLHPSIFPFFQLAAVPRSDAFHWFIAIKLKATFTFRIGEHCPGPLRTDERLRLSRHWSVANTIRTAAWEMLPGNAPLDVVRNSRKSTEI
jgi:hypothetical protein